MKKYLSIMATIAISFVFAACSSSDDEAVNEPTMNDIDLSKSSSIVGEWITSERQNIDGEFEYMNSDEEIWDIKSDGTMIRYVSAYKFPGTYTYNNGVLKFKRGSDVWTYNFSHHNEFRLKVKVILNDMESLSSTYLIRKYE